MAEKKGKVELGLTKQMSIPDGIKKIDAQLKAIEVIESESWKTPGKITTTNGVVDLKSGATITVEEIVKAYSSIKARIAAMLAAYDDLGIKKHLEPKIDGGTEDEWKQDCILKIKILQSEGTKKKLTEFKNKWTKFMSEEDQKNMLIEEMNNFAEGLPDTASE